MANEEFLVAMEETENTIAAKLLDTRHRAALRAATMPLLQRTVLF